MTQFGDNGDDELRAHHLQAGAISKGLRPFRDRTTGLSSAPMSSYYILTSKQH
jgi:hypothetical protein